MSPKGVPKINDHLGLGAGSGSGLGLGARAGPLSAFILLQKYIYIYTRAEASLKVAEKGGEGGEERRVVRGKGGIGEGPARISSHWKYRGFLPIRNIKNLFPLTIVRISSLKLLRISSE